MMPLSIKTVADHEPWAEALAADRSAITAREAAADAVAFPLALGILSADLVAKWSFVTGRLGAAGYGEALAAHHGRELHADPAFAALLRAPETLEDVGVAAARFAHPMTNTETHQVAEQRAAVAAIARYKLTIARQLATLDGDLGDAGRALLECAEATAWLDAEEQRREQLAAAELERVADEQKAARAMVEAAARDRVAEAAAIEDKAKRAVSLAERNHRLARVAAIKDVLRARLAASKLPHQLDLLIGHQVYSCQTLLGDIGSGTPASELAGIERAIAADKFRQGRDYGYGGAR